MNALSPAHYRTARFTCECIDITRHLPFLHGNAFKYIWRHADKHAPYVDLGKAQVYLRWAEEDTVTGPWLTGAGVVLARSLVHEHVTPFLDMLPPVYRALPMIVEGRVVEALEHITPIREGLPEDPATVTVPEAEAAYITGLLRRAADEPIPESLRDAIDEVARTWPERAGFDARVRR